MEQNHLALAQLVSQNTALQLGLLALVDGRLVVTDAGLAFLAERDGWARLCRAIAHAARRIVESSRPPSFF